MADDYFEQTDWPVVFVEDEKVGMETVLNRETAIVDLSECRIDINPIEIKKLINKYEMNTGVKPTEIRLPQPDIEIHGVKIVFEGIK